MRRKDMDVIINISGVIKGFIVVSSLIKQSPLAWPSSIGVLRAYGAPLPAGDIIVLETE